MTPEQWLACAEVLATFYPHNFKVSDEAKMELWFRALEDLEGENVLAAVWHMVKTQPAFPSVADIRTHAEPSAVGPTEAWTKACTWVSRKDQGVVIAGGREHHPPEMDDPAIMAAIDSIGFTAIRMRTYDEEPAMRAHFFRAYTEAKEKQKRIATYQALGVSTSPALPSGREVDMRAISQQIGRALPPGEDGAA